MRVPPTALHLSVAARAAILSPYETRFYDVIRLSAFSSLPLPLCGALLDCRCLGLEYVIISKRKWKRGMI